ncbi:MAG: SUMF1/EgtB/PvdO family nonheme iron enzyme [Hyphomicrobiales bacterium]
MRSNSTATTNSSAAGCREKWQLLRSIAPCIISLIFLVFCSATEIRAEGRKVAFVIGNSDYQNLPPIGAAKSDANRMADALQAAGFEVVRAINVDRDGFNASFRKFQTLLDGSELGFFHYSGHSVQIAGRNRIVPVDAAVENVTDLESQTVNLSDVVEQIRRRSPRHIVIFDACHDDPFPRIAPAPVSPGCAKPTVSAGTLIVLAAEPDQPLLGDSLLTESFLSRAFVPGKDINAALVEVRRDIIEKSDGGQVIYYNSGLAEGATILVSGSASTEVETEVETEADAVFTDCAASCPVMVRIAAGTFGMGNASGDARERPVHEVSIKPFAMSRYEISVGEWQMCVAAGKCRDTGQGASAGQADAPVGNVTWDDAVGYAEWLSGETGKRYRLPSESEWEYAARAGGPMRYSGSNDASPDYVDCKDCGGEHKNAAPRRKDLKPNAFGLAGMSGGVAEWVMDCWKASYEKAPADGSAREGNCTQRVLRGGSWRDSRKHVTVTSRHFYDHDVPYSNNGLRIARDL